MGGAASGTDQTAAAAAADGAGAAGPPGSSLPIDAHEAATSKALLAEGRIGIIRLVVILFNSIAYVAWLEPAGIGHPPLAWSIIVLANVYGVYVVLAKPYRTWPVMQTTRFTALTDGVLITLWIAGTGGFASPFYLLWYLSLVAVAFRYDSSGTVWAAVMYGALYVGVVAWMHDLAPVAMELAVRTVYIGLVGSLGALLARDSTAIIEDRLRLEARLERSARFRILAEAAMEGICIHRDGHILDANPALCRMLGRSRDQMIGTHVLALVAPESASEVARRLESPDDSPYEALLTRLDHERVLVQVQGRDFPFGGKQARMVAVRDITQEREAQKAQHIAAERQAEVERLEKLNTLKTEFINTAAHELNTPLTPIRLQLHMLRRRAAELGTQEQRALEMLDRNLDRLGGLVRDMLDMARLQAGRLSLALEPTDLQDIAAHVAETFSEQARAKEVHLVTAVDGPLPLVADEHRVEQILVNLVSNAIKFTPPEGTVRITATARDGAMGPEVHVAVSDTGVGLDEAQVEGLFQPFGQQHGEAGTGTGLGLYISKGLAERHGGRIEVHSEGAGKGAVFTLVLPVEPAVLAEPPPA